MSTITKVLVQNSLASSTVTAEFTAGSNERAFCGKAVFTNTSASNVTVTIYILASGETATSGSGGNWTEQVTIPPSSAYPTDVLTGLIVDSDGNISISASVTNVVNINISGASEALEV